MISLLKKTIGKLFERKDIVPLIISIGITIVFLISYHFWGSYVVESMGVVTVIAWAALILLIMLMAGFTVLKTLFILAAELSLLIFLAQSFCSVTQRSTMNFTENSSLRTIFVKKSSPR